MDKSQFNFNLPKDLIAQTPLMDRTLSKFMVINKELSEIKSDNFYNIVDLFQKDDVLVLNDTKVIAARLYGIKEEKIGRASCRERV